MIATSRTDANSAPILVPLRQVAATTARTTGPDVISRRICRGSRDFGERHGALAGEVAAVKKTLDEMRLLQATDTVSAAPQKA